MCQYPFSSTALWIAGMSRKRLHAWGDSTRALRAGRSRRRATRSLLEALEQRQLLTTYGPLLASSWAQLGPIGAICQWCLGNDVTIAVVAALYVVRLLTEEGE
jgi:hypothetical protein